MPTLQRKAITIHGRLVSFLFRPAQNASAPALVFLHGWRSEAAAWQGVLDRFGGGNACYALDLPAFGHSPAFTGAASLDDYAQLVEGFIDKQALERVIVVGHSFGGRIAIKLAARKPAWLQKLVLTGAAGVEHASAFQWANTRRVLVKAAAKAVKPLFRPAFMQPLRTRVYRMIGSEDYVATPTLRATFQNIIDEDLQPLLGDIAAPTLLVWGGDDEVTPPAFGELMERTVPSSRLVVVEGAGHYVFIDVPEKFLKELEHFIT